MVVFPSTKHWNKIIPAGQHTVGDGHGDEGHGDDLGEDEQVDARSRSRQHLEYIVLSGVWMQQLYNCWASFASKSERKFQVNIFGVFCFTC